MSENNSPILTPRTLWVDFKGDSPLKSIKINEVRYDKITYEEYYFSGREVGGERVRIFGVYATPDEKEKYSALLYIPDITERLNFEMITEYAKMGYAVLVVDLYGKRRTEEKKEDDQSVSMSSGSDQKINYTFYPSQISYANYEERGNKMDMAEESAKKTSWYEWVGVAKYALNFLKEQPNVEKIGVIGVKDGANIAWQLAGTEDRLDCCVALFNSGWSAYRNHFKFSEKYTLPEMNNERRRYIAGVEAHAYAQRAKCPILFLSSTNSERFDFDKSFDTLNRIPEHIDCVFNFAPGLSEHLDLNCKKDVELFLKKYLGEGKVVFPQMPVVSVEQEGKYLTFTVKCDMPEKVAECKVYLNEGVINPALRNWALCDRITGEVNKFEYVINGNTSKIFAFAVVRYRSGATVSSWLVHKETQSQPVKKTGLIYSSKSGLEGIMFYDKNAVEEKNVFIDRNKYIKLVKGAGDIYGAYSHCGLISYKLSEASCKVDAVSILKVDVFTSEFCVLKLTLMKNTAEGTQELYYTTDVKAGKIWRSMAVNIEDFKSADGTTIDNFDNVYAVRIESDGKCAVNNIMII